ncbi:MAG: aspartate aminotransferase family protein [Planctomycetes bacterium]|nr:aspartate aminotransferase family protein [Planctomycetota bacterium]
MRANQRGCRTDELLTLDGRLLSRSLGVQFPMVWERARGSTVWDVEGNSYLDLTSAACTTSLGHCHPAVTAALGAQLDRLDACYEFAHPGRTRYAERLLATLPFREGRVLFKSAGGEAVDTAMLLAQFATGRRGFVSFTGGFHGGTFGSLAVTGEDKYKQGFVLGESVHFAPYPYCYRCPLGLEHPGCDFGCVAALSRVIDEAGPASVAALTAEPMQGSAGLVVPPQGYWPRVAALLRERGILMIVDEIQTGFGRTGAMYAFEHYGVVPDIVVLSKGIANGFPMAAVAARDDLLARWGADAHSSTFGGNPLACAAAAAVLDVFEAEDLVGRSSRLGTLIGEHLAEVRGLEIVGDIRGRGAFWGVEFVADKATRRPNPAAAVAVRGKLWEAGLLTLGGGPHGNMVRMLPALTIELGQLHQALRVFTDIVKGCGGLS